MAEPVRFQCGSRSGEFQLTPGPVVRFPDQDAALALLRSAAAEPATLMGFRRALEAEGGDAIRLTDEEVLVKVARLLNAGRWHLSHRMVRDRRFPPGLANRRADPIEPAQRVRRAVEEQETFVLAVEVKTIGGTLLLNHPVRVIDPDSGEVVVDEIETDSAGVVRTRVPEEKTYRVEILDEEWEHAAVGLGDDDAHTLLACRFVDEHGAPVADEVVECESGDHTFEVATDADGRIESPAAPGHYRLRLRGATCDAHTLLRTDCYVTGEDGAAQADGDDDGEPVHYHFVVPATASGAEDDDPDADEHRLTRDFHGFDGDELLENVA